MPGFTINGQGGDQTAHTTETRRNHRWVFEILAQNAFEGGRTALLLLQKASRPKFTLEEPMMHHNQEQVYFAGKQSWDTITLTWYDAEQDPDISSTIWDWLNVTVNIPEVTVAHPRAYKRDSKLSMLNGTGDATEQWDIFGCWGKEVNWGDLDYTDTEIATVEVIMRYDRAVRLSAGAGDANSGDAAAVG